MGQKYPIELEVTSKPVAEYQTDEYFELDLPTAPAIMVGEEIVVEGADVAEAKLEAVPCVASHVEVCTTSGMIRMAGLHRIVAVE